MRARKKLGVPEFFEAFIKTMLWSMFYVSNNVSNNKAMFYVSNQVKTLQVLAPSAAKKVVFKASNNMNL